VVAHCVRAVVATSDASVLAQHAREVMKAYTEMAEWVGLAQ